MEDIIKELQELEEMMMQCMKCGTCQSDCPLYRTDQKESSVARGKISLIQQVYEGRIEDAGAILEHIDKCLLCGRCKHVCPSGVKTDEIFLKGRDVLRKLKKLPKWQKFVLNLAMEKPELLGSLAPLMHMGLKFGSKKIKDDVFRPMLPMLKGRSVVSVKSEPFSTKYSGIHHTDKEMKHKVFFYPGCAINYIFTDWGEAIIKVLNHFGVTVEVPDVNICCGIPAASMGDLELYRKMVGENLDMFEKSDAEYIITSCPTCRYGLYEMGEKQVGRKPKAEVVDILVFIEEILRESIDTGREGRATIHYPCHYQPEKKQIVEDLLANNTDHEYVKLANQSCCGFAGTFSMKHYDRSKEFAKSKMDEIKDKEIKTLYSPCPGCVMQLVDGAAASELDINVEHPVLAMYEKLKGEDE